MVCMPFLPTGEAIAAMQLTEPTGGTKCGLVAKDIFHTWPRGKAWEFYHESDD